MGDSDQALLTVDTTTTDPDEEAKMESALGSTPNIASVAVAANAVKKIGKSKPKIKGINNEKTKGLKQSSVTSIGMTLAATKKFGKRSPRQRSRDSDRGSETDGNVSDFKSMSGLVSASSAAKKFSTRKSKVAPAMNSGNMSGLINASKAARKISSSRRTAGGNLTPTLMVTSPDWTDTSNAEASSAGEESAEAGIKNEHSAFGNMIRKRRERKAKAAADEAKLNASKPIRPFEVGDLFGPEVKPAGSERGRSYSPARQAALRRQGSSMSDSDVGIKSVLEKANKRKEELKVGGKMPSDVRDMLLSVPGTPRARHRPKSLKAPETPVRPQQGGKEKAVEPKKGPPPTIKMKFEEEAKRQAVAAYLASPKRQTMVSDALSSIKPSQPPEEGEPSQSSKLSMTEVIVAAAAAKAVKMKSKEDVPPPSLDEVAERECKRLLILCRKGEWDSAGETLKALDTLVAQETMDRKILTETADSITGTTPIMYAAIENRMSFMERMLGLGCNINKKNKEGYTALHFAAMYSREDTVNWLMAKRANPDIRGGPMKQTCIHLASARSSGQSANIVKILLSHAGKEARFLGDATGTLPLFCAIEAGNTNVCKQLLAVEPDKQLGEKKSPLNDTPMHLAARRKDANLAKVLIEAGAQVDLQNREGQTPLHLASIMGDESFVRVLFMARANANLVDNEDRAPIHLAAERGFSKIVEFLAEKFKASIYERTRDGSTLMHIAAINGHPETAMILFDRGVPLLMPNKFGARGIHTAAKEGHVGVIQSLLKKGESVDSKTADGKTPLHIAVEHGKGAVVEALLGFGANVNGKGGEEGEAPLHVAARIEEAKGEHCTKILLKSGGDPNMPMGDGQTAVHIASHVGNLAVLRALLQSGGDAQLVDKNNETGLHKATKNCHIGVCRELIQFIHGFIGSTKDFVNKTNCKGETGLHYACLISKSQLHFPSEDRMIVKMLMENGAEVTIETETQKESAFHYVSHSGNTELLQEIIAHTGMGRIQLSVNKQNSLGWAPLLCSASRGHDTVVEVLLANNARVDVFDNEGRSALHLAAEYGSMGVCKSLLAKNAFVNSKNKHGLTALHYAASKGNTDLVGYLVNSYGASIESLTIKKQTPMHLAAANGKEDTVQCLVDMEAMVDFNDELDQKPIHMAAQNDHTNVVKMFLHLRPSLVSACTKDGNTLAHLAAKKGSSEVLQAMFDIDKTLVTSAKNRFNENSPLHLATEGGHIHAVKLMLMNGVNANEENKFGLTPVHMAAKCGHADIFDVFAKSGVSLKSPSSKIGMTALHIAAYYGEEDIARELFKHIPAHLKTSLPTKPELALIEALCYESDLTPIHLASYSGSENVVRALLNQPGVEVRMQSYFSHLFTLA